MRVLVLGDTHTYFERIVPQLEEALKLYNYDAIFQVGDLCYLPKKLTGEKYEKINQLLTDFVEKHNLKFYWIDGNHEDHSVLQHVEDFNNSFHNIYGKNFIYMPRGSFMEIGQYVLFFIGGAETRDGYNRIEGIDYFEYEEMIFTHQYDYVLSQIDKVKALNKKVIVIAHTVPKLVTDDIRNILNIHEYSANTQNKFLDIVLKELHPVMYFHGHFHREVVYNLPDIDGGRTTFFSIGAYIKAKDERNDKKFFLIEI